MNQPWMPPEVFAVAFVGVAGPLLALVGLMMVSRPSWRRGKPVIGLLALVLAVAAGVAVARQQPQSIWVPMLVLAGWCVLLLAIASGRLREWAVRALGYACKPIAPCVVLLLASPVFALWWPHWVESQTEIETLDVMDAIDSVGVLEQVKSEAVVTDLGHEVQLFSDGSSDTANPAMIQKESLLLNSEPLANQMIRTAGPDMTYNCHGWVFTGGQCWVKGDQVDTILHDNGYRKVRRARAGDIVVYRDTEGTILHTGLVRATGERGFVLVESKWGRLGRYIHAPTLQIYGDQYGYYRSRRHGHLLNGLSENHSEAEPTVDVTATVL